MQVDIWAVGCLAYELITGRPPFRKIDADKDMPRNFYLETAILSGGMPVDCLMI